MSDVKGQMSKVGAVILAAGRSRRMGRQKLLLPWKGGTVISHIVDEVLAAGVGCVVVVVGADEGAVREALVGRAVEFVRNPDDEGEMITSVRCGLRALAECGGALIVLGDQPALSSRWIKSLISLFDGRRIVLPSFDGKRGHPVLLPRRFFDDVLSKFEGDGLKGLLDAKRGEVVEWPVDERGVVDDLDTPEDYARAVGNS
jgi:molybdenum cofactor cytidylyltransferase